MTKKTYRANLGFAQPKHVGMEELGALPVLPITGGGDHQADNNARATFAAEAIVAYTERVGDNGELVTQISDLLGDLMHLCDATAVDFDFAVATATMHYDAEIKGEL